MDIRALRGASYSAALVLTASCTAAAPSSDGTTAADVEGIKQSFAGFVAASEAGDADAYAAYLTEDALYLGPGAPAIVGREAIREFAVGFFAEWTFSLPEWTTEEITVSGDLAVHRHSGVPVFSPKAGGDSQREDRKYMDVMRRTADGRWLLARHMYNLNQ